MSVYNPTLHIEEGDRLIAHREEAWGHIGDRLGIESNNSTIVMQFQGRAPRPNDSDCFMVSVNTAEEDVRVHIDTIGDITGLADTYALYRNGGGL